MEGFHAKMRHLRSVGRPARLVQFSLGLGMGGWSVSRAAKPLPSPWTTPEFPGALCPGQVYWVGSLLSKLGRLKPTTQTETFISDKNNVINVERQNKARHKTEREKAGEVIIRR